MKHLLIFTLLICSASIGFGQTVHHVNKLQTATWDKLYEKWRWDEEQDTDMTVTIDGTTVNISNNAKTTITTTSFISEQNSGREIKTIYNAVDQSGKKCTLIFVKGVSNGKQSIAIMYPSSITIVYRFE